MTAPAFTFAARCLCSGPLVPSSPAAKSPPAALHVSRLVHCTECANEYLLAVELSPISTGQRTSASAPFTRPVAPPLDAPRSRYEQDYRGAANRNRALRR